MKGKKGVAIAMETIVKLILLLSIFIILGLAVQRFIWGGESAGDYNKCKFSIYAAARSKWAGQTTVSLDCPRKSYVIKEEDVSNGGTLDHELVKKEFFGRTKDCWDMVGKGELHSFDELLVGKGGNLPGFACLICTSIEFEDSIKKKYAKTPVIPGFNDFLKGPYDGSHSYGQMISSPEEIEVQSGLFWYEKKKVGTPEFFDKIDINEKYYLVYAAFPGAAGGWMFSYLHDHVSDRFKTNEYYGKMVMITEDNLNKLDCKYGLYN